MKKYKYNYIIQLKKSPTRWKDICKMDDSATSADVESKLNAFQSRNPKSYYRVIRTRVINENSNIFRKFE